MYNFNYRDVRPDRQDMNLQAWQSMHAQHQLQQQHQQRAVQSQQRQHQQIQQQQAATLQHGLHQLSSQQQQQQQTSLPVKERLWVEISDDEDSALCYPSVFKSEGKTNSQQTPPLDLSTMEKAKMRSRHIESPLDLSVKTRKRVADTTDYLEFAQGQGQHSDVSLAKRMFMGPHNIGPSQGLTKERQFSSLTPQEQQKNFITESMMKAKFPQKHTLAKLSPRRLSPQSNSLTSSQQQYVSIQRQHQMQKFQQNQQHQQQQRMRQMSLSPGQFHGKSDSLKPSSRQLQREHSPYPSVAGAHPSPTPQSSSSETVALQGFFEPTQRLTVNTGLSRSSYNMATPPTRSEQSFYPVGESPLLQSNMKRQREVSNMDEVRCQMGPVSQFSPASSLTSAPNLRPEVEVHQSGNAMNFAQMEVLQQRQLQRQRQLQVQREQSVVMSNISPSSTHGNVSRMIHQELVSMPNMYDSQKRLEPSMLPSKVSYPSPQGHINSYPQKLQHNFMSNTSSHPSAITQEERKMYNHTQIAGAGQSTSVSELQRRPTYVAKNQSQRESFSHIDSNGENRNISMFQSKQINVSTETPLVDTRQRPRHNEMFEEEHRYRMKMSENVDNSYPDRMERLGHMSSSRKDIHPSVIQKPQGFIPPRIVSGSGRASTSSISDEHRRAEIVQRRYSNDSVDPAYIDNLYRRHSSDSLTHALVRDAKYVSHIRKDTPVNRNSVPRQQPSSINSFSKDLTGTSQVYHKSKSNYTQDEKSLQSQFQRRSSNSNQTTKTDSTCKMDAFKAKRQELPRENKLNDSKVQNSSVVASALSGVMIPQMIQKPTERSITKGTSGLSKDNLAGDFLNEIVIRELKKTEASSVNPYANRSILEEYDRSRNTPFIPNKEEVEESACPKIVIDQDEKCESQMISMPCMSTYDHPLQISIPGSKPCTSTSGQIVASAHSSISSGIKQDMRSKSPKILSRKQMILRAFKQEEDMKNTVNIDKDQKIPIKSHKFASSKKSEKDHSQLNFPPSPKMPILSPQERNRTTPIVSPGTGDPPNLEATPVSSSNLAMCPNQSKTSDINSFEEHLHKLISDAVKGSVTKDKDSVYETVCRELTTQPQGKVFITRQLSQNKNIPVANVAPIVHGRNISDSNTVRQENKVKVNVELNEEDKKLAAVVTRSLFESSYDFSDEKPAKEDNLTDKELDKKEIKIEPETDLTVAHSIMETDFKSKMESDIFHEDPNVSKRMSPGLKKLMLYRHRDLTENSQECATRATESDCSLSQTVESQPTVSAHTARNKDTHKEKDGEAERNVFGTFNEILAQKCSGKLETDISTASWTEIKMEDEELNIQMVPNTDYDGDDDEDVKEPKKLPRRTRKSSVKQQADRLIKKARHRRKSEGMCRAQFSQQRSGHKGFVDFTPQVLPNRTRFTLKGKSPPRKCRSHKKDSNKVTQESRSSSRDIKSAQHAKLRKRRSSSVDRHTRKTPSVNKSKPICYSDNEIDNVDSHMTNETVCGNWHDESTDEDYFQSYQEKFKQTETSSLNKISESVTPVPTKKVNTNKKRKGFHFKQKYIFQRKRKPKNKTKAFLLEQNKAGTGQESFNFHEEVQRSSPIPYGSAEIGFYDNIPIPPEVKRLAVNKDTGETLLHRAARMGHEEVALYCLATGTVDVNARDNAGYTALHECCVRGHQEIARILLTHGADVNCCSVDGIRPIHDAVEIDQLEMVRLLLSFGADPTLSTYAGRSLLKIARSERMKKFLHDYHNDLNGYETESSENLWNFEASSILFEPEDRKGCAIFHELPSDPEEEVDDLCTLSAKPLFLNRRLAAEHGKRVEDFVLLQDILNSYSVTKKELDSLGISAHLIKRLSVHTLQQTLADSIFMESFMNKEDQETVPALRAVDSAQLMAKLEKYIQSKKTKA